MTRGELRAAAREVLNRMLTAADLQGAPDPVPGAIGLLNGPCEECCAATAAVQLPHRPGALSPAERRARLAAAIVLATNRVHALAPARSVTRDRALALASEAYCQVVRAAGA